MGKNIFRDIMTREQRSIHNVPLPRHRGQRGSAEEDILYESEELEIEESASPSWRRFFLWGATVVFLMLLGVALATSFTGATITVTPRRQTIDVHHEFVASKDAAGKLRFEAIHVSKMVETAIPADTTKHLVQKASGTIVIYNAFSLKPQRLIKNTRFETRDGLMYRIGGSVTVPGKTLQSGKTIPGSVEAVVSADAAGAEYNIPLSDFTVPGFKGDAERFAGFYARSKTPIAGGFDGAVKVPSDSAMLAARASLQKELRQEIAKAEQEKIPAGYVFFDGAGALIHESLPPEERRDGLSAIRERETGAMYLFKGADITKAVASAAIPKYDNLPVMIPDIRTLKLELKDPVASSDDARTLRFTLTGNVDVVWLYDEEKLKTALIGKPRDELAATLSAFPTIEKADLVLRPFWSRNFPGNPRKFSIEEGGKPSTQSIGVEGKVPSKEKQK